MGTHKKSAATASPPPYNLWTNNRFWLLVASSLMALLTVVAVWTLVPAGDLRLIRAQQTYGLLGILFLYVALLAAPLTKLFPNIKGKNEYLHLRRAIGVSAFFFALLHSLITFFGQLGGINGIGFLSPKYGFALLLGVVGLIVLTAMAVTSFDAVIEKMGFPRWKRLHRLIYIAALAILLHVVMLGTHFAYGSSIIAWLTAAAVLFLLVLEAIRIDRALKKRFAVLQQLGVPGTVTVSLLFLGIGFIAGKNIDIEPENLRVHSSHDGAAASHNGHDEASENGKTYISFDPSAVIDGSTIQVNQQQLSLERLIAGGEVIAFTVNPGFTDTKSAECFLVNQQTYAYYQGLTKLVGSTIQCLPIGDVSPPVVGAYTLYLRLERSAAVNTVPFNLEITK